MTFKRILFSLLLAALLCASLPASAELNLYINRLKQDSLYPLQTQLESQLLLNALEGAQDYVTGVPYDSYERTPYDYVGDKIAFSGSVEQVLEGENGSVVYRIAEPGNADHFFYVEYNRPQEQSRILEKDYVDVYAVFSELKSYTSTTNLPVTVPYCKADLIILPVQKATIAKASDAELRQAMQDIAARLAELNPADEEGYVHVNATNYVDYARSSSRHTGELIRFSGKVVQVAEGRLFNTLRIAVDCDENRIMYTLLTPDKKNARVLENDQVTVYASSKGLYTYESTLGGMITIPSCLASRIENDSYDASTSAETDESGYSIVTGSSYDSYARMPDAHKNEKIRFEGKVIQVIEGDNVSQYRVSVGGDSNKIVYVTLPAGTGSTRVLEDDDVTVYAAYNGLLTYKSTMNVGITVPSCTAERIEVRNLRAVEMQQDASGAYIVDLSSYDSFARKADEYLQTPITFTAKVIQVIEGDGSAFYRMAVGGNESYMLFTQLDSANRSVRLLEGDQITAQGLCYGLYTYDSTLGGQITIPSCLITSYTINNQRQFSSSPADADGYHWITADNFHEYARNPDDHMLEPIRFMGKVVQVIVRANQDNTYRIAVDSDEDEENVFYVQYAQPAGTPRVLEDDVVMLSGVYMGLVTYSTTLNSEKTVPFTIANAIGEPPYKTLTRGHSNDDVLNLKKRLQELGYLAADDSLTRSYNTACQSAVKLFQKACGLKETGVADVQTQLLLYAETAIVNPDSN